jgi:hypothetical protein
MVPTTLVTLTAMSALKRATGFPLGSCSLARTGPAT